MIGLTVALGAAGYVTKPTLNSRVFSLAPGAPTLAPAFTVAAFNSGIASGLWLGGLAQEATGDYRSLPLVGACLAAMTLVLLGVDVVAARRASSRRRSPRTSPDGGDDRLGLPA